MVVGPALNRAGSTTHHSDDEYDEGDDEKEVDDRAKVHNEEAQEPHDDEDND